jgi:glycosyltransferase involved in cell wall biosynthesis
MNLAKKHSISVVLPCLNEEETVTESIKKALLGIEKTGCDGEVIVADNGSTDQSAAVAKKAGARVVSVTEKGYGAALMGGFAHAKGDIFVMGDADDTYDFREIALLYEKLQEGYDLVSGNRLKGNIDPEAMPWIHRFVGVPALTFALNVFFPTNIYDAHCGMRMFTREAYERLRLFSPGMEFASEMLIRARRIGLRMCEVPISYGQRHTKSYSKLNTFRDGFRHLALILRSTARIEDKHYL